MPKGNNGGDKSVNVELPAALVEDLRAAIKRLNPHRTKTVVGAAIAAFLAMDASQVDEMVRRYISSYMRPAPQEDAA